MQKIPENIQNSFVKLKEEIDGTLVLRNLNGHFYVYRASSRWDKKEKRVRSKQEYIGRINSKGIFIEKSASYEEIELEKARALIEGHGGKVTFDGMPSQVQLSNNQADVDEIDKKILMILSMNARATMPFIAKMTGLSTSAAEYRVKRLEEKFGIKYILEPDIRKLGYTTYLIFVKFETSIPNDKILKDLLNKEYRIQFAARTTGDYDLIMYLLDEDPIKALDNLWVLRAKTEFGNYPAKWYLVPYAQTYSFIPLREEFIDWVLKEKEWYKTKDSWSPKQGEFKHKELIIIKELNKNSVTSFSEIDKKYNLVKGTASNTYEKLSKQGVILRPTITMEKAPYKYINILFLDTIRGTDTDEDRYKILLDTIGYTQSSINKYALVGNIGMPNAGVYIMPVIEEKTVDQILEYYKNNVNGSSMRNTLVLSSMVGSLCYRLFDNTYSRQYKLLVELKQIKPKSLFEYKA